jgi:hypothetical protein
VASGEKTRDAVLAQVIGDGKGFLVGQIDAADGALEALAARQIATYIAEVTTAMRAAAKKAEIDRLTKLLEDAAEEASSSASASASARARLRTSWTRPNTRAIKQKQGKGARKREG